MEPKTSKVHNSSLYYHVVFSPRELVSSQPLIDWLLKKKYPHILTLEHGDNKHPHLEMFLELHKILRDDKLKPMLMKLYPDIPKTESKNVKVTINRIDPDPRYGYGYSLKETIKSSSDYYFDSKVLSTSFTPEEHQQYFEYYQQHKANVTQKLKQFVPKSKKTKLDEVVSACAGFVLSYVSTDIYNKPKEIDLSQNITYIIESFFDQFVDVNDYTTFSKINKEKLTEFCRHVMSQKKGGHLLTVPLPTPPFLNSYPNTFKSHDYEESDEVIDIDIT